MTDATAGVFTTVKLQSLLDSGFSPAISNRKHLAQALGAAGQEITVHGINAWFRKVDSNYALNKDSLTEDSPSFALPRQRWNVLCDVFALESNLLALCDVEFDLQCLRSADSERAELTLASDVDVQPELRNKNLRYLISHFDEQQNLVCAGFVAGQAGSGKSHVANEYSKWCLRREGILLQGICLSHGSAPLLPLVNALGDAGGQIEQVDADFAAQCQRLVTSFTSTDVRGIEQSTPVVLLQHLVKLAHLQPITLLVDDCHLMDKTTQEFLEMLMVRLRADDDICPFRLLTLFRPNEPGSRWQLARANLAANNSTFELAVEPLIPGEVHQLLLDIYGDTVAQITTDAIWPISEGNPLLAKQIYQHLRDKRHFKLVNGYEVLSEPLESLSIPVSATAYYLALLDELDDVCVSVLGVAACIGRDFVVRDIELSLQDLELVKIVEALECAESKGLIQVVDFRYEFTHPLARFAVVQSHTTTRIAFIHYQIASRGEALNSDSEIVARANHMVRGATYADPSELGQLCHKAISIAMRMGAWDDTVRFFEVLRVLDQAVLDDAQWAHCKRLVAKAHHKKGQPDPAMALLHDAALHARTARDHVASVATLNDMVHIQGNFGVAQEQLGQNISELGQLSESIRSQDSEVYARSKTTLAVQKIYAGDNLGALVLTEEASKVMSSDSDTELRTFMLSTQALAHLNIFNLSAAHDIYLQLLGIAESSGNIMFAAQSLQRLSIVHLFRGDFDDVLTACAQAEDYGAVVSQSGEVTLPMAAATTALVAQGKIDQAVMMSSRALEILLISKYAPGAPLLLTARAQALLLQGQTRHALACVESLMQFAGANDERSYSKIVALFSVLIKHCDGAPLDLLEVQKLGLRPPRDNAWDVFKPTRYAAVRTLSEAVGEEQQSSLCEHALNIARSKNVMHTVGWHFPLEQNA